MKLKWQGVPAAVRRELEPLLKEWAPILPAWLDQLAVSFAATNEDSPDCPLSITPQPEYRIADLVVHAPFLLMDAAARKSTVLHEVVHVALEPAYALFNALLDATYEEGSPEYALMERLFSDATEGCVTDLELGLGRLLDPHKDGHA